jgi:hypothetical protein
MSEGKEAKLGRPFNGAEEAFFAAVTTPAQQAKV